MQHLLPTQNLRDPAALSRFLLTCLIGLALDQWTKVVAFQKLNTGPYAFIPGWLHFQITRNPGAVFGIGRGMVAFFIVVSIGAVLFISYLFLNSGRQWFYQIILGMLLAGVLGNVIDRIAFGYVRDMIYAIPGRTIAGHEIFPWIFNVADTMLCTGVFLLLVYSFFQSPHPKTIPPEAQPGS